MTLVGRICGLTLFIICISILVWRVYNRFNCSTNSVSRNYQRLPEGYPKLVSKQTINLFMTRTTPYSSHKSDNLSSCNLNLRLATYCAIAAWKHLFGPCSTWNGFIERLQPVLVWHSWVLPWFLNLKCHLFSLHLHILLCQEPFFNICLFVCSMTLLFTFTKAFKMIPR